MPSEAGTPGWGQQASIILTNMLPNLRHARRPVVEIQIGDRALCAIVGQEADDGSVGLEWKQVQHVSPAGPVADDLLQDAHPGVP
jgi:hypothetical protein